MVETKSWTSSASTKRRTLTSSFDRRWEREEASVRQKYANSADLEEKVNEAWQRFLSAIPPDWKNRDYFLDQAGRLCARREGLIPMFHACTPRYYHRLNHDEKKAARKVAHICRHTPNLRDENGNIEFGIVVNIFRKKHQNYNRRRGPSPLSIRLGWQGYVDMKQFIMNSCDDGSRYSFSFGTEHDFRTLVITVLLEHLKMQPPVVPRLQIQIPITRELALERGWTKDPK